MMTLTQAEIEIYKRVGQFADRSKYLIGSTLLLIGDNSKNLGTELNTTLENIVVRTENQMSEKGQPFKAPANKPWCKVSIQYADSQVASIGDGPCIRDYGMISIQCFTPKNNGTLAMTALCDQWRELLQSFGVSHLEVYKVHAPQSMDDQDFYAKIIRAEFRVN